MASKMTKQQAQIMMDQGYHCSQVVMGHIAECMEQDVNAAMRLTAGMGAGCNHGDTCGVISAGVLAIGMIYGFDKPNATEENDLLVAKVHEFEERFLALHHSTLCRVLLNGYDAAIPDMVAADNTWDNCNTYCEDACTILDDMLGAYYKSPVA